MADYKLTELMTIRCAKEIKDGEVVFVGVGLPLVVAGHMRFCYRRLNRLC